MARFGFREIKTSEKITETTSQNYLKIQPEDMTFNKQTIEDVEELLALINKYYDEKGEP